MTILDTNAGYVVIINTFSVDPAKADALLSVLIEATEQGVSTRPGFVSANWHISKDKRYVTNYAQWRSQGDIDAMMADPDVPKHLRKAHELADRVEPISYELRETLKAAQYAERDNPAVFAIATGDRACRDCFPRPTRVSHSQSSTPSHR